MKRGLEVLHAEGSRQPAGTNAYRLTALARSGATFAQGDITGTWHYVNFATTIGAAGWAHGTVSFDAAGRGTFGPQLNSSGATETPAPVKARPH